MLFYCDLVAKIRAESSIFAVQKVFLLQYYMNDRIKSIDQQQTNNCIQ